MAWTPTSVAFAESCVLVVKVVGVNRSGHVLDQSFPQSHSRLVVNGLRVGMLWAVEEHLVFSLSSSMTIVDEKETDNGVPSYTPAEQ